MTKLRVFPDTGTLVAAIVFTRDHHGQLTLAGEVLDLYQEGAFDLLLSQVVVDELEEVIDRDFPEHRGHVLALLAPFEGQLTRWPTPQEIRVALPYATDPDDAPVFAAAVVAQPDIVLSNDFHAFHSRRAKKFWAQHQIQVESLCDVLRPLPLRDPVRKIGRLPATSPQARSPLRGSPVRALSYQPKDSTSVRYCQVGESGATRRPGFPCRLKADSPLWEVLMEAIRILEKPAAITWDYDEEVDVLYLSIGEPQPAVGLDIGEGIILRYDEARKEVVGLTLIGLRARLLKGLASSD